MTTPPNSAPDEMMGEIERRAENATPGPWTPAFGCMIYSAPEAGGRVIISASASAECGRGKDDYYSCGHPKSTLTMHMHPDDQAFIAHAREDIPWLLAQHRALEAENSDLHMAVDFQAGDLMQRDEKIATLTAQLERLKTAAE